MTNWIVIRQLGFCVFKSVEDRKKKSYLKQAIEIHQNLAKSNEYLAKRLEKKIEEYEQYF